MAEKTIKPPTPQGISRLLRAAKLARSEPTGRGGYSTGFIASRSYSREGAVEVTHRFWSMGNTTAQHMEKLGVYVAVLEEAGWSCQIDNRCLIVTARDHSPAIKSDI